MTITFQHLIYIPNECIYGGGSGFLVLQQFDELGCIFVAELVLVLDNV